MSAGQVVGRIAVVLLALGAISAGCATGTGGGGRSDAAMDSSLGNDAGTDAAIVLPDTGTDTLIRIARTCESCTSDVECGMDAFCARLVRGGSACLPRCDMEFPSCPLNFTCIFDATGTGVSANVCAPVGGPCCVDEDEDEYGVGIGCMGDDCNDMDGEVHPDRTELCDGRDTNCNGTVDEPPTDCESGICSPDGDGTYSALSSGLCADAACGSGTISDCGLYTCNGGGDMGLRCARSCNPTGADDDDFCIASAHCDTGICVADIVPGGMCDEDTDCDTTHCDNGFCCGMGTCCNVTTDCPGGGGIARVCDTPTTCQGSRGETMCNAMFQCATIAGIADDTGCATTTLSRDCGLVDAIYCDGSETQTARMCPTSCLVDADCIDAAHCSVGFCVPDLPPGGPCARPNDCQDGLSCTDGICCTTSCNGSCEACNVPGSLGTCTMIPANSDRDGECAGFSCSGYYDGFSGGGDVCYRRTDVSDAAAVCNGAGACVSPDVLCTTQPRGPIQIDCNDTCQTPESGTCSGTNAGTCHNLDDPSIRTMCGAGACAGNVQRCVGGSPAMCTMGTPMAEVCNGIDDDCVGGVDNGSAAMICPPASNSSALICGGVAGCAILGCNPGFENIDGVYGNGCECGLGQGGIACGDAFNLGSLAAGGSASATGIVSPGAPARWFRVDFPIAGTGQRAGRPRITVSSPGTFRFSVASACAGVNFSCSLEGGTSTSTTDMEFYDQSGVSGESWATRPSTWPTTAYIQVTRSGAATTCAQGAFTITVTR